MLSFGAGGPVTSLVVGVLVLAIYVLTDPRDTAAAQGPLQDALADSVFMLGVVSVGIGFMTLLPINQGRIRKRRQADSQAPASRCVRGRLRGRHGVGRVHGQERTTQLRSDSPDPDGGCRAPGRGRPGRSIRETPRGLSHPRKRMELGQRFRHGRNPAAVPGPRASGSGWRWGG